jgi:hypothetical protein
LLPPHDELQQTPSAHTALAQADGPAVHGWPGVSLHSPTASQVMVPLHVRGSGPFVFDAHAPEPATQRMHDPLHAAAQQ